MKSIFCVFYLFLANLAYTQEAKKPFSLAGEFLLAYDFSINEPLLGKNSAYTTAIAAGLVFNVPIWKKIHLETGYRWKEHWFTRNGTFLGSASLIEVSHSIPLRPTFQTNLAKNGYFSDYSISIGSGPLVNFMRSDGIGGNSSALASTLTIPTATITVVETLDNNTVHKVKQSVSWDSRINLNLPLFDFMDVYIGYGYNRDFRTYVRGTFTETITPTTGAITTNTSSFEYRGTYSYFLGGLRFNLNK